MKEAQFLELFNRLKSELKGRKSTTKALIGTTESNFKKLVKAGYNAEDFEGAIIAMFRDPEQWAVSTFNDNPEHLLRPDNFARYLNSFVNAKEKKKVENTAKLVPENQPAIDFSNEIEIEKAKEMYSKSLKNGEWLGTILDAQLIGRLFSNSFTSEEKKEFKASAEKLIETDENGYKGKSIGATLERMARRYPTNIMFELAVKEAVKRKIVEPWK